MPGENDGQSTNTQTTDPGANGQQPSGDGSQPAGGTIMTGDGQQKATGDGAAPAGAPEKYEFTVPEGLVLDNEVLARYEPIFREANLTNEAAQKLLNQWATDQAAQAKSADEQLVAQHEKWVEGVTKDPEIGGNNLPDTRKFSQAALARFGTPELKNYLNLTGLGSHPELVRAFAKIGRAMGEDTFVNGNPNKGGSTDDPNARALQVFPSMNPKN